jgi:AcrR family transcriptional regulator
MNVHSYIELAMTDRKSRKNQIVAKRQEQILKAATEVFSQKGYTAATVPEIAELAGVAIGTIYIYYPGKRELFIAVIKNLIITVPLLELIEKMPKADTAATFKDIFKNRLALTESDNMVRIASLMGEIQRDPELKALWVERFLQPFMSRLEGLYRAMAVSGKIRRMDPALAARTVGSLIIGLVMLKSLEGKTSPLNRLPQDEVADALVNFVLHGLINDTGKKKDK